MKINTVFSLDGFEVCIAGKCSGGSQVILRSLMSCFLPHEYMIYAKRLERLNEKLSKNQEYMIDEKYDGISEEENLGFLECLFGKINGKTFSKMPGAKISADEKGKELFKNADTGEQVECLMNILLYLKTNRAGTCDLSTIGGKGKSAAMILSANIRNWKYSDIRIIDRSASGLYETRSENLRDLL